MENETWKLNLITSETDLLATSANIEEFEYGKIKNPENFTTPKSAFLYYFSPDILKYIAASSNKYFEANYVCEKIIQKPDTIIGHFQRCGSIKEKDILSYIAVRIGMGINCIPDKEDYWSGDPIYHNDAISSIMTRLHFRTLEAALHATKDEKALINNSEKITEFMSLLLKRFQGSYQPKQDITIDESMIPFKGRSKMKFYLPNKPIKWGFIVFAKVIRGFATICNLMKPKNSKPI